jgi:hypothetical protein
VDWFLGGTAKYLAVKAGSSAAAASVISLSGETPIASGLDWLAGQAAGLTEAFAKAAGIEMLGAATAIDVTAHLGCAYAGNSQASQGLVNETLDPSNMIP